LYCNGTAIGDIDLSNNTKLTFFSFTNNPQLTSIRVCDNFSMDSCLFTSAGNNPNLSIFNTMGKVFFYIGQYSTAFGGGGVVYEISDGGQKGNMISVTETTASWASALMWGSSFGTGWNLPTRDELHVIYNRKSTINSALTFNGFNTLKNDYYWTNERNLRDDLRYAVYLGNGNDVFKSVDDLLYARARLAF
jgi:hypothetical protein